MCRRKVFSERLPQLIRPHGQSTLRLDALLTHVGVLLDGEAGSHLARELRAPVKSQFNTGRDIRWYGASEGVFHHQIDLNSKRVAEEFLQFNKLYETRGFWKCHQNIEIAVRALFLAHIGPKQRDWLDLILVAKDWERRTHFYLHIGKYFL